MTDDTGLTERMRLMRDGTDPDELTTRRNRANRISELERKIAEHGEIANGLLAFHKEVHVMQSLGVPESVLKLMRRSASELAAEILAHQVRLGDELKALKGEPR